MARANADGGDLFSSESELIQTIFAPLARGTEGAFELADDAALLRSAPGEETVLTCDMLVEGRHFLSDTPPADIGWKALAVNVSDLIAKGADPKSYLLALGLPRHCGRQWLSQFAAGLDKAQQAFGCRLAGGDTTVTPGPLTISITALGSLPEGRMVHRSGANAGDSVYVTSTIGDAVAGLHLLRGGNIRPGADADYLIDRHRRPAPQPAIAAAVRDHASAAMDISDGLAGDFAKLCAASGRGGAIEAAKVPLSGAARALIDEGFVDLETLLTGGDDYCVLATIPPGACDAFEAALRNAGGTGARIGRIQDGDTVNMVGFDGEPMRLSRAGFDHFAS